MENIPDIADDDRKLAREIAQLRGEQARAS
jgi:hypothetical protein